MSSSGGIRAGGQATSRRISFCERYNMSELEIDMNAFAKTFAEAGAAYDCARPTYPDATRQIILEGLRARSPAILEIGCGSGQATELFLPIASRLDAIDPSEEMVAIARDKFRGSNNVFFTVATFESAPVRESFYDIVLSAQAFHWVNVEIGLPKAARALKGAGRIALMWNYFDFEGTELLLRIRAVILRVVPHFRHWPDSSHERFDGFTHEWREALAGSGLYRAPRQEILSGHLSRTKPAFRSWLTTLSWMKKLDAADSTRLLADIDEILGGESDELRLPLRTLVLTGDRA